ncbi:helix-turn-helix domain-containing protein [Brevundimonas naejangsanensis]|uniref:helix-turn-helix domain-containing protein n=1 Tax=Brevundimonas naejangsanensis TaxID=588932 RepID=UPI0014259CF3|nr:helix-turn-helix transcriptional regulator [Brevundimonas naejangsanensis]
MGSLTEGIRQARLAKGCSQRDLSARARLTQAQISRIENGEVDTQVSTLIELARSLDLALQLVLRTALVSVEAAIRSAEERSGERSSETLAALRRLAEQAEKAAPEREDIASIASTLRDLEPHASAFLWRFLIADMERLKTNLEGLLTYPPASRPSRAKSLRDAAAWLKQLRSTLMHAERPAYSLDDED